MFISLFDFVERYLLTCYNLATSRENGSNFHQETITIDGQCVNGYAFKFTMFQRSAVGHKARSAVLGSTRYTFVISQSKCSLCLWQH